MFRSIDLERMESENAKGLAISDLVEIRPIIPFLRAKVSPMLQNRLREVFLNNPIMITDILDRMKKRKPTLSRPAICANLMRTNTGGLYLQAQSYLNHDQRGLFSIWYNLAVSYSEATRSIHRAEGVLKKGARLEVIVANKGEIPENAEEVVVKFQRYSEKLKMDPTGVSLMDYQASSDPLRDLFDFPNPRFTPYYEIQYPSSVLGKMYAAEVYKAIYPLSE